MAYSEVYTVEGNDVGQRIDNFLMSKNRAIPKSRYYRAIRSGEVRVNKKRVTASYRIQANDQVRIPPFVADSGMKADQPVVLTSQQKEMLERIILFESNEYMLVNKPFGIAVHAGSGIRNGLVDQLISLRSMPLYLVHRLDKDVSGCLLLAKNRQALNDMIDKWSTGAVKKIYHALVFCESRPRQRVISRTLTTSSGRQQTAMTELSCIEMFDSHACVELRITTGRKHQIRRHLADEKIPIIGDVKYGDFAKNKRFRKEAGEQYLYLIAKELVLPIAGESRGFKLHYPDWWSCTE